DGNLNGSEFLRNNYDILQGKISSYDNLREETSRNAIEDLNQAGYIESCHDLSNGGLITALAEMTFERNIGVKLDLDNTAFKEFNPEEYLLAETPSRYIIEISSENIHATTELLEGNVSFEILGKTISKPIIEIENFLTLDIDELYEKWSKAIPQFMED
ncbi:MAG: hypothetical protein KGD64_06665, partial [Candidatus Heimdallarchaeota archaeon]|nr:hypothetical protein [Candidatus Heimdallarchaeota archaeon]